MRFAAMFVWIVLPVAGYIAYATWGAPHFAWSYRFEDNGDPYNPLAERHYLDCTFIGPYGGFTVPAESGRCSWIKFFKHSSRQ